MKYIMMIIASFFLSACQSSSEQATQTVLHTPSKVSMQIGKSYTVNKNDMLNKTSDDAVVKITQKTQEKSKEVVLVSGSAEIVYK